MELIEPDNRIAIINDMFKSRLLELTALLLLAAAAFGVSPATATVAQ